MMIVQVKGVMGGIKLKVAGVNNPETVMLEIKEKLLQVKELLANQTETTVWIESTTLSHSQKLELREYILNLLGKDTLVNFDIPREEAPVSVFHTGTLRSGQKLYSEGHLIVQGDVNPGAEIKADGNIVVLGTLKGIVHAGASGDRSASVSALVLAPTQIRIADVITRAPDEQVMPSKPETAYILEDRIYIESLVKK
ncbi:MAG: septum site-determining protein MinC [Monoglobales bacterium]